MTTTMAAAGARTRRREKTAAIETNPDNAESVKITVGSKNFTEQKVLGEIYAQGLEAAGYTVKKELNLGDEKTALKALEGKEIDALPGVHGHGAGVVLQREGQRDPQGSA